MKGWLVKGGGIAAFTMVLIFGWFCLWAMQQGFRPLTGLVFAFTPHPAPVQSNPVVPVMRAARVSWLGDLDNRELAEASGLTASPTHADVLWSINDSGDVPRVFATGMDGSDIGFWHVAAMDVAAMDVVDWEALDSFVWEGQPYLVIGDVGDNFHWRETAKILFVPEPATLSGNETLPVARQLTFTFPDGGLDVEAMAVDPARNRVLVISKRTRPPVLYALPLTAADDELLIAEEVAALEHLPKPTPLDREEQPRSWAYRHMPSGMDVHGDHLLLTTYRDAFLYDLSALDAAPHRVPLPTIGQREALTFMHGSPCRAFITRERSQRVGVADVFRIDLPLPGCDHTGGVSLTNERATKR